MAKDLGEKQDNHIVLILQGGEILGKSTGTKNGAWRVKLSDFARNQEEADRKRVNEKQGILY